MTGKFATLAGCRAAVNASLSGQQQCDAAGHCCVGDLSSYMQPSCAMGVTIGQGSKTLADCEKTCEAISAANNCTAMFGNHTFNLCGVCPKGCDAADGVGECLKGCAYAKGAETHVFPLRAIRRMEP